MKKILFVFILAIVFSSCTQVRFLHVIYGNERNWEIIPKQDVPAEVIKTFENKYQGNTATQWMKPSRNKYAASFTKNGKVTLAVFSTSGLLQDEEDYDQEEYYQDEEDFDDLWGTDSFD